MISAGLAILGAAAAINTPAPSVTLISPQGSPIGGQYQRWVSGMKVPTVGGLLAFESPAQLCVGGAAGCSQGSPASWYPGLPQGSSAIAASDRFSLYFELGHQFDFRKLTWPERGYLAWFWRASRAPWVDSMRSIEEGGEDGLEAQFAYAYALCAEGGEYFDSSATAAAPADAQPPTIRPRNPKGTCTFIDRIK